MSKFIALHHLLGKGRDESHPVCHDDSRTIVWSEFAGRVHAQTAILSATQERRWLLAAEQPLDFAVLFLALLHSGKEIVIPPNTRPGTLNQLKDSFDGIADGGSGATSSPITLGAIDPQKAIIDLYTSGSTGEPKRIRKTLAQFESEISSLEKLWGNTLEHSSIVSTVPHHHIYGLLFRLLWPLSAGRAFDNLNCAHPDTLNSRLDQLRDCALVSSPAQLTRLPELVPLASLMPAPRIIFSSGGPLPKTSAEEFNRQLGRAPTEIFGSTETGGIAWRRQENDDAWTLFPEISANSDQDGALVVRSPFLSADGQNEAELRMADAAELLTDKRFRLLGRLDRIVKIEEKRLSLPELEARLTEHPWIVAGAAVALAGRRQQIGAVLVLNTEGRDHLEQHGRRSSIQELRRFLAQYFEAVMLPRRWRFAEQLPINERGKLTHAALSQLFSSPEIQDEPAAP